jgi:hypothetical protein
MGELSSTETIPLFLLSFSGLLIGFFVLLRRLDRWIERLADLIVQRGERRREKALTKPRHVQSKR